MRKGGAAEWMMERAAGEGRGSAIYGDLVEMAAARGSVWFWVAYARTLIALTWRTAAAFVVGLVVLAVIEGLQMQWLPRLVYFHLPHAWRSFPFEREHLTLYNYFSRALSLSSFSLCFLAPYAAVRFGMRDRMVQTAFAMGLTLTAAFALLRAWPLAFSLAGLALVMAAGALLDSRWRAAFASVAATTAAGAATLYCLLPVARLGVWYFAHQGPSRPGRLLFYVFLPTTWGIVIVDMLLLVAVSSWLHRRLVGEGAVVARG